MVDAAIEKKTGAEDVLWDLSIFYSGVDDPAIQRDLDKVQADGGRVRREISRARRPARRRRNGRCPDRAGSDSGRWPGGLARSPS